MNLTEVGGAALETLDIPAARAGRPAILLLHEGLGSVSMWRDFPALLAEATGARVVAYSREGFGRSSPRRRAWSPRFVHEEALEVIPALRERLSLGPTLLLGHSTGASMAIVHAGHHECAGVVAVSPIVFVEGSNLDSIRAAREAYYATTWRERLARHHDDADAVFHGWSDTWLAPAFAAWTIAPDAAGIRAPIVAILGGRDEYVTAAQVDRLAASATSARSFDRLDLPEAGHAPHRDAPGPVLQAVVRLLDAV